MNASAERRKEARYVVEGLSAEIGGMPVDIIDISATAVRLARPDRPLTFPASLQFRLTCERGDRIFLVPATLVRESANSLVLSYPKPDRDWNAMLARIDTLGRTQLHAISFE